MTDDNSCELPFPRRKANSRLARTQKLGLARQLLMWFSTSQSGQVSTSQKKSALVSEGEQKPEPVSEFFWR
jgi:hypothetical protein